MSKAAESGKGAGPAAAAIAAAALGSVHSRPPDPVVVTSAYRTTISAEGAARGTIRLERDQVNDMIAASESRISEGVVRAISDLRVEMAAMNGRMLGKSSFYVTTIGTGLAILSAIIAVLAFGGDRFSQGIEVASAAQSFHVPEPAPPAASAPVALPTVPKK